MTENQTAVAEPQPQEFTYPVSIQDAGPATKKVSVEIPPDRIAAKLAEQFKQLRSEASIPGFRNGHAPQKLIEKRFGHDVKEQVRRSLISESYQQAVEKNNLQVIGEPDFENPDAIQLPEQGALSYSFSVEVQPDITLPPLTGLKVKKPKVQVLPEHTEQAFTNLREQQGALVPVEDRGVEAKDFLVADVHVKHEGNEIVHDHDAQIVARPGRVGGIVIPDLAEKLAGLKPGEKREFTVAAPAGHANEAIAGKDVQIEIALKDIKRLEPAVVNQEFLNGLGFDNEQELRDALKEQMLERIQYDVQQSMREQINNYLLDNIHFELPSKLSDRQAERVVQRRKIDLLSRGMPEDQVEANAEIFRAGAKDEAVRELKLFFILQKVANDASVDVSEAELNGRVAMLAAQRGARPEKLKQEMSKDGSLTSLYIQMREQRAIDRILERSTIEEVEMPANAGALENKTGSTESATHTPDAQPSEPQPTDAAASADPAAETKPADGEQTPTA